MASGLAASAPADAASSGRPNVALGFGVGAPRLRVGPLVSPLVSGPSGQLFGVFCISKANCWAVGEASNSDVERNQVLHWTGRHWSQVAVPNPGGTRGGDQNELFAVRCPSANSCWAVGETDKAKQAELDQALHWNGRKWSAVSTPTPGGIIGGDLNMLNDVTCTSVNSCWAAGDYGTIMPTMTGVDEVALNQVLHWNGNRWSLVSVPNPAGEALDHVNVLAAVRCASPTQCWAAGTFGTTDGLGHLTIRNEMLHWNGRKWFKQTVPNPGGTAQGAINEVNSLACATPANCWAAGTAGIIATSNPGNVLLNDILHWNGKKWSEQTVPNPGGGAAGSDNVLLGITCALSRDCWAVGGSGALGSGSPTLNEALHYNGTKWSLFKVPNPSGTGPDAVNILNQVRCTTTANCWAVGVSAKPGATDQDEILHWTGKKWFAG